MILVNVRYPRGFSETWGKHFRSFLDALPGDIAAAANQASNDVPLDERSIIVDERPFGAFGWSSGVQVVVEIAPDRLPKPRREVTLYDVLKEVSERIVERLPIGTTVFVRLSVPSIVVDVRTG